MLSHLLIFVGLYLAIGLLMLIGLVAVRIFAFRYLESDNSPEYYTQKIARLIYILFYRGLGRTTFLLLGEWCLWPRIAYHSHLERRNEFRRQQFDERTGPV